MGKSNEASAIVSSRMGENKNRFAFAFADFANWQPNPVKKSSEINKRRKDRSSLQIV
jgi:hypothetical protein